MSLWSVRRPLYKAGVLVQHLGFLIFVVGFCMPYWFHASPREGSQGLWLYCNGQCHKLQVEEEWFEAVRALLCFTLIVYLMACVLAVYGNCLKKYDPLTYKHSRRIEITTATAGLMGALCMVVYTVMMKLHYQEYRQHYFGSAYGVTMGGCLLALIAAVILAATARPLRQHYVRVTSPIHEHYSVTYQSTSQNASAPPQFAAGIGDVGGSSAAWKSPTAQPYRPCYIPQQSPDGAGCSYGFPTQFSNPAFPSTSADDPYGAARHPKRGPSAAALPPPYTFQNPEPSAPSPFLQ